MTYDLIVMGGGPAGSAAAITAARLGARVLLLERGRFPRHKVCGEFVSSESLSLLRSLLDSAGQELISRAAKISKARLFIGNRVVKPAIAPPAASITRFDLDAALWQAAQASGVETRSQTAVERVGGSGLFTVATSAGAFEARAVIDSTGRWSNLKAANSPTQKNAAKWIGLKAHFGETSPNPSVDLYFFNGGYCGVQPVQLLASTDQVVNACAMVRADVALSLKQVFAQHPALLERSRSWEQRIDTVSTSPLIFAPPAPERNGILCAGDAAGFVDPFIGDGISLALHSGRLAAGCLRKFFQGEADLQSAMGEYRHAYAQQLLPVFRRSARLRRLLSLPHGILRWILPVMEADLIGARVVNATRVRASS